MSRSTRNPVLPRKGVKPYETPGRQEGKQGGQENSVVLVVSLHIKLTNLVNYVRGFGEFQAPLLLEKSIENSVDISNHYI